MGHPAHLKITGKNFGAVESVVNVTLDGCPVATRAGRAPRRRRLDVCDAPEMAVGPKNWSMTVAEQAISGPEIWNPRTPNPLFGSVCKPHWNV